MLCNSQIHDELKNMDESTCPFCCQLLVKIKSTPTQCCIDQNILEDDYSTVCQNCGSQSYKYVSNYIDFYENMYKIRRKSIYQRKYHIENVMNDICFKNRIDLTHDQRDRIYKIFIEIDSVIHSVNKLRRRIISTKYILRQLFKLPGLHFKCIKITDSRKTLEFYNRYWAKILELKNAEILHIIRQ